MRATLEPHVSLSVSSQSYKSVSMEADSKILETTFDRLDLRCAI